ncbi:MAG: Ig-like domain-containing protein [Spirochaetia bacterium]
MKNRFAVALTAVLCCLSAARCGIIDLSTPGVLTTNPESPNRIMEIGEKITVTFPRPVDTAAAESAIQIRHGGGSVYGSYTWDGDTAVFVPDEDLSIGTRYELIVEGLVPAADGRVLTPRVYVPFYVAVLPDAPPRIISVEPGVLVEDRAVISVSFSRPMDGDSVEIECIPHAELDPQWNVERTVLELSPGRDYPNGEILRLSFSSSAADTRGVRLSGNRDYSIAVEYDTHRPRVETVGYALASWREGFPYLGFVLDDIGPSDALRISFSEPMEPAPTEAGIALIPDTLGHRVWISDTDYVFVPELGWRNGTEYLLTLGPPAADTGGNPPDGEAAWRFTPRFSGFALEELRPLPADGPPRGSFSTSDPLVFTPALYGGDYTFQLVFSQPVSSDRLRNAVQRRAAFRPLYPHSLPAPRITGLSWPDPGTLTVSLTGFERSGPGRKCFYSFELGAVGEISLRPVSQLLEAAE